MKINILLPEVYNRIAAGEVVDRPYSVVKELVENALDAGAGEISVEVAAGGKTLIRVTDNGCGLEKDDLPRAFLPHATSKLSTADDLFHVQTLGFRGEAVASIAAVSRMKIVSDAGEGAFSLASNGGALGEVLPAAGARGTEVTVEDLFFNTPARLKFLKSDAQEESDVSAMMARFILSHPTVSFTYTANGKVKYRSFGDGLQAALAAVYGAGILSNCLEIAADKHGVKLSGYIGSRSFSKPNRGYQSLFVNGRYVVNQTVSAAMTSAYSAYLMKRQYPFYVLFLDVPPETVDVNVHPNKADVRFADNRIIYGSVLSVVSAVLDGNSTALEYVAPSALEKPVAPSSTGPTLGSALGSAPPLSPKKEGGMSVSEAKKQLSFAVPSHIGKTPAPRFFEEEPKTSLEVRAPTGEEVDWFEENRRMLLEKDKAKQERVEVSSLEYKGELFHTYLIYEDEGGDCAYLIDQHAAHERLNYDKLQRRLAERKVISQPMLAPFVLDLSPSEFLFLEKNFPALREIGFEVEEFGGESVKVSAVPSDLVGIDLNAFFAEVLSSMETLRAIKLSELMKDKLASMACKAAVKGGERLTEEEAKSLLARMQGDMGLKCPHGRPVAVKVKRTELEKLFKRIV